jgi:hypothetical protein
MKTNWLFPLAFAAAIVGCDSGGSGPGMPDFGSGGFGPGMQDFDCPVAGQYKLVRSSAHQITVVPANAWSQNAPIIPAKVVEIVWDDTFVLAKQQQLRRRDSNP